MVGPPDTARVAKVTSPVRRTCGATSFEFG